MAAMFREFRIAKEGVSGAWAAEGCVWVWVWVREREDWARLSPVPGRQHLPECMTVLQLGFSSFPKVKL